MTQSAGNAEAVRTRLAEIVGEANTQVGDSLTAYADEHGAGDRLVAAVFPIDERQVAEVAALANAERIPVIVWGGGTKQAFEPVQPRKGIILGTGRLNSTVELDAPNLTVTVGAGKVVDDLQRELAQAKLFLPLDPVDSALSTIGGTLATNSSGPNRLLYRTSRDLVLGLRAATPLGRTIRAGQKTVKDVAGYDLKKLYIGSWGTLGAITEATFRLLPLPEARATVAVVFSTLSDACATVSDLLASFLRPSCADLLGCGAMPGSVDQAFQLRPGDYLLMVAVEGAEEATDRQKRELLELATRNGARDVAILEGAEEADLWQQRKQVFAKLPEEGPAMLVKGSVPLSRVLDFVSGLSNLQGEQGLRVSIASHAGNGIVYALLAADAGQEEILVQGAGRLQQLAGDCGGFALVQRAPEEVASRVPLWPPRSDYGIMRGLKAQLDPNNLWSPARTPGGGTSG